MAIFELEEWYNELWKSSKREQKDDLSSNRRNTYGLGDDQESRSSVRPLEYLQSLELPMLPESLKNILELSWVSRFGGKAVSAVAAQADHRGEPIVRIKLSFKRAKIEEEFSFIRLKHELENYMELALEEQKYRFS